MTKETGPLMDDEAMTQEELQATLVLREINAEFFALHHDAAIDLSRTILEVREQTTDPKLCQVLAYMEARMDAFQALYSVTQDSLLDHIQAIEEGGLE